jgi:hypothetical protein
MKKLMIATAFAVIATPAQATMPLLTPMPATHSKAACDKWAAVQDEDAIEMWGVLESGGTSRKAALLRLSRSCLGIKPPKIVGFGSSAGFDRDYCSSHPKAGICAEKKAKESGQ